MFRHVVLFRWAEGVTGEQQQAIAAELAKLPAQIPAIREYRVGPDAGLSPANHDFAVVADFDDAGGYLAYRDHPAHRAVVDTHITPILAERAAVQYEC
jgi:hypothetical protein